MLHWQLGQQKEVEAYPASCHSVFPYCLAFMPACCQDKKILGDGSDSVLVEEDEQREASGSG
uniref:Uncharacterized protein n=1 Tax=Cyprinodon variegatus TaxID=28743 RepID=A0A3Q2DNY3_CYPVA